METTDRFMEIEDVMDKDVAKKCTACKKLLRGRTDKKFCNEYCRNNFNNRLKSETNNQVRNINNALGKNRRILEKLLRKKKSHKVSVTILLQNGFHFKYFTHQYVNKKGNTYLFCYDFGYLPIEHGNFLLVNQRKKQNLKVHLNTAYVVFYRESNIIIFKSNELIPKLKLQLWQAR